VRDTAEKSRNATSIDVHLSKGYVSDDVAVAAIVVPIVRALVNGGLEPFAATPPDAETDPPDITRYTLWEQVSITAAGAALGPSKPPYVRGVHLRVGAEDRRLIVFGDRQWESRLGGGLTPSAPQPFDRIELDFKRAFGGGWDVPPGLMPDTGLPHPGFRVSYSLNGAGIGYYPDEARAKDAPLPNIELPDQLLKRWNDTPEPAGFSPCRDLVALRMKSEYDEIGRRYMATRDAEALSRDVFPSLRLQHHAPGRLIFDDVPQGTAIELLGLGTSTIRFTVPPAPTRIFVRLARREVEIAPKLRALHIDEGRGAVRLVYDHTFRYDPHRTPAWIRVALADRGTV